MPIDNVQLHLLLTWHNASKLKKVKGHDLIFSLLNRKKNPLSNWVFKINPKKSF